MNAFASNQTTTKPFVVMALCFFGFSVFLFYPLFFPEIENIGYDEFSYLRFGQAFAKGHLTQFAWTPLSGMLYAPFYHWPGPQPLEPATICGIGRLIIFCLLWLAAFFAAKEMRFMVPLAIPLAISLISPAFQILILKTCDGLFTAASGLAFWQVLAFYRARRAVHLCFASVFLGLSVLARIEGLFLWLVFVFLWLRRSSRGKIFEAAAVLIPFFIIVGGYSGWYRAAEGRWEWKLKERTYLAFEWGEGMFSEDPAILKDPFHKGPVIAGRLYGTPEENNYSVWNAARRNPRAFWSRVKRILMKAPRIIVSGNGGRFGILFLVFAGIGVYELIRQKQWDFLWAVFLWPAHLLGYFFVAIRPNYFTYAYFPLLVLVSAGVYRTITYSQRFKDNRYAEFMKQAATFCAVILVVTSLALRREFPISKSKDTYGFFPSNQLSRK